MEVMFVVVAVAVMVEALRRLTPRRNELRVPVRVSSIRRRR